MAILLMMAGLVMHALEGSSSSCFPRGHKEQFKIVTSLITSRICSKLWVNKLLRIMIFAYDLYKLFIYIVVSHFSILLYIKNIFASNYQGLFHSQKTRYLGCRVSLCNWSSKRQNNFVISFLRLLGLLIYITVRWRKHSMTRYQSKYEETMFKIIVLMVRWRLASSKHVEDSSRNKCQMEIVFDS